MIFFVLEKQIWYFFHDSSCKIFQSTAGNTEKKKRKKGQEKKKAQNTDSFTKAIKSSERLQNTFKTFDEIFCWNWDRNPIFLNAL